MKFEISPLEFVTLLELLPGDSQSGVVLDRVNTLASEIASLRRETQMAGEDLKALITAINADIDNIDADITRILERIPAEGGLDAETTANFRADLTALKARTSATAAREPEPVVEPPVEG